MMKISIKILLAAGFLFFSGNVFAQGSGSSEPAKSKSGAARRDKNNFAVTRSVSGSITSIKNGGVVVKGKNGKNISLRVTEKTQIGGCLRVGRNVKVIYTPNNRVASLVRCQ